MHRRQFLLGGAALGHRPRIRESPPMHTLDRLHLIVYLNEYRNVNAPMTRGGDPC